MYAVVKPPPQSTVAKTFISCPSTYNQLYTLHTHKHTDTQLIHWTQFPLFFFICIGYTYTNIRTIARRSFPSTPGPLHTPLGMLPTTVPSRTLEKVVHLTPWADIYSLAHWQNVHLRCPRAYNWSGFAGSKMPMTELVRTAYYGWTETYSYILPCSPWMDIVCVSIHERKFPPWHFSNSSPSYLYNGSNYNYSFHHHAATTMIYSLCMWCIYTIFQTIVPFLPFFTVIA